MKPTGEQIRKFWEWCGFIVKPITGEEYLGLYYHYPDCNRIERCVELDLNNLFRYAVPKLVIDHDFHLETDGDNFIVTLDDPFHINSQRIDQKDPALALFWAIYKVLDGK